jgi:putative transcriptional regulator
MPLRKVSGGKIIKDFSHIPSNNILSDAVLDLKEFSAPVLIKDFCKAIGAEVMTKEDPQGHIYGYTVIDSMKAIMELPPTELVKLYGLTSERALIFTGANRGRSSMVALKVTNLRPSLVILQGASTVDELAKRIAEIERIPLAISKGADAKALIDSLKTTYSGK